MPQPNDLSRSLVALDQDSTIIAVVEVSQSSWLVAGMLPGIERQPRKKLEPSAERLLGLLHRWRDEAVKAGRKITRIALAFEAGRKVPERSNRAISKLLAQVMTTTNSGAPVMSQVRTRLAAGGRWIRTLSTAARKPAISEASRHDCGVDSLNLGHR
jgi:hypothetical protein